MINHAGFFVCRNDAHLKYSERYREEGRLQNFFHLTCDKLVYFHVIFYLKNANLPIFS